jgi:hypothetical protein
MHFMPSPVVLGLIQSWFLTSVRIQQGLEAQTPPGALKYPRRGFDIR